MRRYAALAAFALLAACSGGDESETTAATAASAAAPAGPAAGSQCTASSAEAATAAGVTFESGSTLNDVQVRRQSGSSSCRILPDGAIECRMRNPGLVRITAGETNTHFEVPQGRNATLTVSSGQARCILN